MNAWHTYAEELRVASDLSCEAAIKDRAFQARMAGRLRTGQQGTLQCKDGPELESMAVLFQDPPILLEPSAKNPTSEEAQNTETKKNESQSEELSGKLLHVPYNPGKRSVAAYMGQEFFLVTKTKGRVALYPTDAVSRDALLKRVGKTVTVRAVFVDRTPTVNADEPVQYPTDADGGPLKRKGYEVQSLK